MQKAKNGEVAVSREGALFSYLAQIGKLTACNLLRKRRSLTPEEMVTISLNLHKEDEDSEITVDEKQQSQDDFLDRVFDSIPDACKQLLKKFYWDHKPMDEIASILHLGNANSAKTKKNRCMNQFKDIAKKLVDSDEFAEDAVRACVERAMLRELLEDERMVMKEAGIRIAALEVDDEEKPEDK